MPGSTLTAVLIVRDEAEYLPGCLDALNRVVDEVVVLDTGSTDATVEIAAAAGARVRRGCWPGDFAKARNAALAAARTDWVLSVDADELAHCDRAGLAWLLESVRPETEGFAVEVHERLVGPDSRPLAVEICPAEVLWLWHGGYLDPVRVRAKALRNAELARLALARGCADAATEAAARYQLGRSLLAAGEVAAAGAELEAAVRLATPLQLAPIANPARDFLIQIRIEAGDWDGADSGLAQLRSAGADPSYADWLAARILLGRGRPGEALPLLRRLGALIDTLGCELGIGPVLAERARAAELVGEPDEATACLALAAALPAVRATSPQR